MLEVKRWWRIISLVILLIGLAFSLVVWFFGDAMTAWRDDLIEQGPPPATPPSSPIIDNSSYN